MPGKPGRKKGSGKSKIEIEKYFLYAKNPDQLFYNINELLFGHKYESTRRNPRIAINLDLLWRGSDMEEWSQSYTLSREGIFIKTPQPLPPGSELEVRFLLPGEKEEFVFQGKVVHSIGLEEAQEKGLISGMAVVFEKPEPELQKKLDCFIQKKSKE